MTDKEETRGGDTREGNVGGALGLIFFLFNQKFQRKIIESQL